MQIKKTIAFTGGGTGGHVFPGLAIAETWQKSEKYNLIWIGSKTGVEKEYVETANISFFSVSAGKFRRYFSLKNITDIFKIFLGILQAKKLLKKIKPAILVSIGGYVSVPTVFAAKRLKIPVVSIICDISLGLATKINASQSKSMMFTYETLANSYAEENKNRLEQYQSVHTVGLPLRRKIIKGNADTINTAYNIAPEKKVLLVLGGSSGSQQINTIITAIIPLLKNDVVVVHQTGYSHSKNTISNDKHIQIPFFTDNYADILARANAVIARAGAGTLWEITACQIPSAVIPLSKQSSRGDQIENAEYFEKMQAIINLGSNPDEKTVLDIIEKLLYNTEYINTLKDGCKKISATNAAEKCQNIIETYIL